MKYTEFTIRFLQTNLLENLFLFVICGLFLFLLYRKYIVSIFDPYCIDIIIKQTCCMGTIIWLYLNYFITRSIFYTFLLLFIFFILGFKCGAKITPKGRVFRQEKDAFFFFFYSIHTILFIFIYFIYLYKVGIATNVQGKLAAREGNSIILYFQSLFFTGQWIILAIKRKYYNRRKKRDLLIYGLFFVNIFFTRSKGAVLNLISNYVTINILIDLFYLKNGVKIKLLGRKNFYGIFLSCIGILGMILFEANERGNKINIFLEFLLHITEFGDIYYLALPNGIYCKLPDYSIAKMFLFPILGPLRRFLPFSPNSTIGFDVVRLLYGYKNPWFGPNPRLFMLLFLSKNIIASIFIIFLVGWIFARVRKLSFFYGGFFGMYFSIYLVLNIAGILGDFGLFAITFLPLITIFPLLYVGCAVMYMSIKNKSINKIESKMPTVSVVTVVYNGSKTIERTIQSVVNQNYDDFEFIVVDGKSSDNTVQILKKYSDKLHYISEPDKGIYDAMNKGLALASGDYLIFLGADDYFIDNNVLCCFANCIKEKQKNKIYYGNVIRTTKLDRYDGYFTKFKFSKKNICHQCIFYPKEIYKSNNYNLKYKYLADYAYNIPLFKYMRYIPLDVANYNDTGISSNVVDIDFKKDYSKLIFMNLGLLCYLNNAISRLCKRIKKKCK